MKLLFVCLLAAVVFAQDPDPDLFGLVSHDFANHGSDDTSALDSIVTILRDIEGKLKSQQDDAFARHVPRVTEYTNDIELLKNEISLALRNRTIIDERLSHFNEHVDMLKENVSTIDARVTKLQVEYSKLDHMIADGEKIRTEQNQRYQQRFEHAMKSLRHIVEMKGQFEEQEKIKIESEQHPSEADRTLKGVLNRHIASSEKPGSIPEIDELKRIIESMVAKMHEYMNDMQSVDLQQAAEWEKEKQQLDAQAKALLREILAIEATRAPDAEELAHIKEIYLALINERVKYNEAMRVAQEKVHEKLSELNTLEVLNTKFTKERDQLLELVRNLESSVVNRPGGELYLATEDKLRKTWGRQSAEK